jgi:hypothetical protein
LARQLARSVRGSKGVIVYDPTAPASGPNAAGWCADYVANGWESFKRLFWRSRHCFVVMDEAADVFERDRYEARSMLRRGRHVDPATGGGGHVVALISQRYVGLDKTAREQCSRIYAFNQSPTDAKLLAEDYNSPDLLGVSVLPKFNYLKADRMGGVVRGVVTIPKKR